MGRIVSTFTEERQNTDNEVMLAGALKDQLCYYERVYSDVRDSIKYYIYKCITKMTDFIKQPFRNHTLTNRLVLILYYLINCTHRHSTVCEGHAKITFLYQKTV